MAKDGPEHHFNAVTTLKLHPVPIEVGGKAPIDLSGSRIRPPYVNMVGMDLPGSYSWSGVCECASTEAMLVEQWRGSGLELRLISAPWLSVHLSNGISG